MDMVLGRQLILVQYPNRNLGIYVYGEDLSEEEFWLLNEKPKEHILMRARAVGGEKSVKRVLRYFGVSEEIAQAMLSAPEQSYEGEYINVSTLTVDEKFVVRIFLKREFEVEED